MNKTFESPPSSESQVKELEMADDSESPTMDLSSSDNDQEHNPADLTLEEQTDAIDAMLLLSRLGIVEESSEKIKPYPPTMISSHTQRRSRSEVSRSIPGYWATRTAHLDERGVRSASETPVIAHSETDAESLRDDGQDTIISSSDTVSDLSRSVSSSMDRSGLDSPRTKRRSIHDDSSSSRPGAYAVRGQNRNSSSRSIASSSSLDSDQEEDLMEDNDCSAERLEQDSTSSDTGRILLNTSEGVIIPPTGLEGNDSPPTDFQEALRGDAEDNGSSPRKGKGYGPWARRLMWMSTTLAGVIVVANIVLWVTGPASSIEATAAGTLCVKTTQELWDAVDDFMEGGMKKEKAINMYGPSIGSWDVGQVSNFDLVFSASRNPAMASFNEDIALWDTSRATTMQGMFEGAASFDRDISQWKVTSVEDMTRMFSNARSFNQDIGRWNTSKVFSTKRMFESAESFNQDISEWPTSSFEVVTWMFAGARSFNQPIGRWDLSGTILMRGMFQNAANFNQDLSTWSIGGGSLERMFEGATAFNQDLPWDVSNVRHFHYAFHDAISFNKDLSDWDVSSGETFVEMFAGASAFDHDLCAWAHQIHVDATVNGMFSNSRCAVTDDPVTLEGGSYCNTCS